MLRIAKSLFDRSLVPNAVNQQKDQLLGFVRRGQELATVIDESKLSEEIDQLSNSALKPFLFVIVGEVKSGKSSLVNALLEAEVCPVDSAPCTAKIQEINYAEEPERAEISEFEERVYLPHAILKHIAIVDTPGTNSIIRQHQVITEGFVPQSDLVLFVFFAKNPYTGSAWDFLRYIKHDWQRNTLFVLQQADLLPTEERKRTVAHIREQLVREKIPDPTVFAVSVKTGMGISALRDYLRKEVVEGRQFTKVDSLSRNLLHFAGALQTVLAQHERLIEHDDLLLGKLKGLTLNLETDAEVDKQVTLTLQSCRQVTQDAHKRLRKRFQGHHSFVEKLDTLKNALASGHELRQWLAEFFGHVQQEINHTIYQNQLRYLSELHRKAKGLAQKMAALLSARPRQLRKNADDALLRRRDRTLDEARQRLATLSDLHPDDTAEPQPTLGRIHRMLMLYRVAQIASGLALVVLGTYLSGLLSGLILGLLGYIGIGYGLYTRNRDRLQERCALALENSLVELEERLRSTLRDQLTRLQQTGQDVLTMFESDLKERRIQIEELVAATAELRAAIETFRSTEISSNTSRQAGPDTAS